MKLLDQLASAPRRAILPEKVRAPCHHDRHQHQVVLVLLPAHPQALVNIRNSLALCGKFGATVGTEPDKPEVSPCPILSSLELWHDHG
jgi:hypothetical protein